MSMSDCIIVEEIKNAVMRNVIKDLKSHGTAYNTLVSRIQTGIEVYDYDGRSLAETIADSIIGD